MSTLSVDMIEPVGSTLTLGQSGDTIAVPSGAVFANSGTSTGFGGLVRQLLEDNLNTTVSTTSTVYVASGLSIAITPATTASRFLLTLSGGSTDNDTNYQEVITTFYVNGSEVAPVGPYSTSMRAYASAYTHSIACLHEPASVSVQTYTVYYRANANTARFNISPYRTVFTVMELES